MKCNDCPESNQPAWIKPDITFFGEEMPTRFEEMMREDCPQADLCLIMGTSLMVLDFCLLPNFVPKESRLTIQLTNQDFMQML